MSSKARWVASCPPTTKCLWPLGAPHKSQTVWDGLEDNFRMRLALWKRQYISKGERLTLIRSTLKNLPLYLMSILSLPRKEDRDLIRFKETFFAEEVLWSKNHAYSIGQQSV